MARAPIIEPKNAALAAGQAAAADDDGGDDVQLDADGDGRVALSEAGTSA